MDWDWTSFKRRACLYIHSRKVTGSTLELNVEGNQVEQVHFFKFLGVTINDTLTWSDHINTVCAKVSCNVNLRVRDRFSSLSLLVSSSASSSLPQILHSPFLQLLQHCLVWMHQVRACHVGDPPQLCLPTVLWKHKRSSASAAPKELGFSNLASTRNLHYAVIMFNCMFSKSPPYLSQLVSSPSSHFNTHSASSSQLNLPPNRSSFSQKSFSFVGAGLRRSLPQNIRDTRDFTRYYTLPVTFLLFHYIRLL